MATSATHKGWLYRHNNGILAAVYVGAKSGASVLAANTALDGVLVGTPVTPALAVDSMVISNEVASGDILIAANTGGNSKAYLWIDASAGTLNLYAPSVMGTSGTPITSTTASQKFQSAYYTDTATSGTAVGDYVKLQVEGTGGSGVAGRFYVTVDGSKVGATIHGCQNTAEIIAGSSITGAANGTYSNVILPNATVSSGTLSAVNAEIFSNGSSSNPSGAQVNLINCNLGGDGTGAGHVDDVANLIKFAGGTIAGGNVVEASTTEAKYAYSARCIINGVTMYLMFADSVG